MIHCDACKPCNDGFPNHCERLQEIGFSVDGGYAKYIVVPAKLCWSLKKLAGKVNHIFKSGSLVEPLSVSYNAVIERGGGIHPGENVVILGAGPIGLGAVAILKRAGAALCIVSEPNAHRVMMAEKYGADYVIDPTDDNLVEAVMDYTDGEGASLYLEATGRPQDVIEDIQDCIWNCKAVNSKVVIVARSEYTMPVAGEIFQVKRAQIIGAQGHSGHGTFSKVISLMASGMDMEGMITKTISLEEVPENLKLLQKDKENCKISVLF